MRHRAVRCSVGSWHPWSQQRCWGDDWGGVIIGPLGFLTSTSTQSLEQIHRK